MIWKYLTLIRRKYKQSRYDPYSIAEYFREQGAQIGENCFFSIKSVGTEPWLVCIGNHVGIASGVQFLTHSLGWNYRDKIPDIQIFGKIVIEDNCNIGVNALILPDVTIGKNSIIAAGSVVTKDIPPNSIAAGIPAKVIGNADEYFNVAKEKWRVQKPEGYMTELEVGQLYTPRYMDSIRSKRENRYLLRKHLTKLFWGEER